ncbi:MCRS1 protein, partial [Halcyon senegalensis]|nr:MCRS1 protein [Halcyon senegalensis]
LMASGATSRSEDEESLAGQKRGLAPASGAVPKRRSSSRFIKRKKFDDELVESSLAKSSSRAKGAGGVEPGRCSGSEPSSSEKKKVSKSVSAPVAPSPVPPPGLAKRMKKSKQPLQVTKDLGRWKPADDLLLINAVLQTNDLTSVHLGVKFSCRFNLREIQERWYALLYDPIISKLACQAMRQLHPEAIAAIQSKVLFSKAEEQLLNKVGSRFHGTTDPWPSAPHLHGGLGNPSRDTGTPPCPGQPGPGLEGLKKLFFSSNLNLPWSNLRPVPPVPWPGDKRSHPPDPPPARSCQSQKVSPEPPALQADPAQLPQPPLTTLVLQPLPQLRSLLWPHSSPSMSFLGLLSLSFSPSPGVIKLKNNGDFFIANEGRRPIYIDGRPVLGGNKWKLNNNSVVEIASLRFVFLINQDLIALIKAEAAKLAQQ